MPGTKKTAGVTSAGGRNYPLGENTKPCAAHFLLAYERNRNLMIARNHFLRQV